MYRLDKTWYSPSVAFPFLFGVILCMNYFGLGGLYKANNSTYVIFGTGVLSFIIGDLMARHIKFGKVKYSRNLNPIKCKISIILILTILSIQTLLIIIFILNGGNMGQIYTLMANATKGEMNELSIPGFYILLTQFIAYPLLYTLVPAFLIKFIKNYEKKYLILAILLTVVRVISDARRTYVVSFVLMLILAFTFNNKSIKVISDNLKKKQLKKVRRAILFITGIAIIAFFSISDSRASEASSTFHFYDTLAQYYGGCVYYLECILKTAKVDFTYGFSSFRGLVAPICGILSKIGIEIEAYQDASSYVLDLQSNTVYITQYKLYNSFASCFYQFYCDFGYLGVVFFSIIYGFISRYFYKSWRFYNDELTETRYVFWFSCVLMFSFVNFELVNAYNALPLILIFWLYDKTSNTKKIN